MNSCAAVGIIVNPLTWSATSLERLIIDTVSYFIWILETLFDTFKLETDETIAKMKPHSLRWYAEKAKYFRFGYSLLVESDKYDDMGLTAAQITAANIVKHAAVTEQQVAANRYGLRIKVAGETAGDLAAVTAPQLIALQSYFEEIKDAGVPLLITTGPADSLKLMVDVYYNPQLLSSTGVRIDDATTPVPDVIRDYLKNLPFNGELVIKYLEDKIQALDGVVIGLVKSASARYGILPYATIDVKYLPDAGYLRLFAPSDLIINYIPQNAIQ